MEISIGISLAGWAGLRVKFQDLIATAGCSLGEQIRTGLLCYPEGAGRAPSTQRPCRPPVQPCQHSLHMGSKDSGHGQELLRAQLHRGDHARVWFCSEHVSVLSWAKWLQFYILALQGVPWAPLECEIPHNMRDFPASRNANTTWITSIFIKVLHEKKASSWKVPTWCGVLCNPTICHGH